MSQYLRLQHFHIKYRLILWISLVIILLIHICLPRFALAFQETFSLSNVDSTSLKVDPITNETVMYQLDSTKYIEWIPAGNDPTTIAGYRIWLRFQESELAEEITYKLVEDTHIINNISLTYVIDKSNSNKIFHVGPMMLFIEEAYENNYINDSFNLKVTYYDIVANEYLPKFLFQELLSKFYCKESVAIPWQTDSNIYIFQTDNYFAFFLLHQLHLETQNDTVGDFILLFTDPNQPEQYSRVYVP